MKDAYFLNRFTYTFICTYFTIAVLYHMWASPFWHIPQNIMVLLSVLGAVVLFCYRGLYVLTTDRIKVAIITILFCIVCTRGNLTAYVVSIINILPFLYFVFFNDKLQLDIFKIVIKILSWVIAISLFAFLFAQIVHELPYFIDFYGSSFSDYAYLFENHFLYVTDLKTSNDSIVTSIPRFSAIFLEPGYFASLLSILLFIDNYNLKKKYNIVFLSAIIFSMSLSAWIIMGVGLLIRSLRKSNHRFFVIIFSAAVIFTVYLIGINYNGGDNSINHRIIERLEYDSDRGTIKGDNRSHSQFRDWFDNYFMSSDHVVFGLDAEDSHLDDTGVGWRYFVAKYGFCGLFVFVVFLLVQRRLYSHNLQTLGLVILYCMFFLQDGQMYLKTEFTITFLVGLKMLHDYENVERIA